MFKTFGPGGEKYENQTNLSNGTNNQSRIVRSADGRQIVDVGQGVGGQNNNQQIARTQADCATQTPDCGSCLAKSGCGWCKSTNSCLFGNQNGPTSSFCQSADWAYNPQQCQIAASGTSCSAQNNCASCLSGSGCKWCIRGSKCVESGSIDSCDGGWLQNSYQCNFASR